MISLADGLECDAHANLRADGPVFMRPNALRFEGRLVRIPQSLQQAFQKKREIYAQIARRTDDTWAPEGICRDMGVGGKMRPIDDNSVCLKLPDATVVAHAGDLYVDGWKVYIRDHVKNFISPHEALYKVAVRRIDRNALCVVLVTAERDIYSGIVPKEDVIIDARKAPQFFIEGDEVPPIVQKQDELLLGSVVVARESEGEFHAVRVPTTPHTLVKRKRAPSSGEDYMIF